MIVKELFGVIYTQSMSHLVIQLRVVDRQFQLLAVE